MERFLFELSFGYAYLFENENWINYTYQRQAYQSFQKNKSGVYNLLEQKGFNYR